MQTRHQLSTAIFLLGTALVAAGCWFAYRDYCDRQRMTVEVTDLSQLQVTTDVEHTASFTLRNHTFRHAKLVSGAPG